MIRHSIFYFILYYYTIVRSIITIAVCNSSQLLFSRLSLVIIHIHRLVRSACIHSIYWRIGTEEAKSGNNYPLLTKRFYLLIIQVPGSASTYSVSARVAQSTSLYSMSSGSSCMSGTFELRYSSCFHVHCCCCPISRRFKPFEWFEQFRHIGYVFRFINE